MLSDLGVATAVGSLAIVVLVGVAGWAWFRRRPAKARPASPEQVADLEQRQRVVRALAAADYSQRIRHEKDGHPQ